MLWRRVCSEKKAYFGFPANELTWTENFNRFYSRYIGHKNKLQIQTHSQSQYTLFSSSLRNSCCWWLKVWNLLRFCNCVDCLQMRWLMEKKKVSNLSQRVPGFPVFQIVSEVQRPSQKVHVTLITVKAWKYSWPTFSVIIRHTFILIFISNLPLHSAY